MTGSGKSWMREHVTDEYVRRARAQGYRSRAAFKLMEIDDRDRLLRPGMRVIELGAAPGSWSQVVLARIGPAGRLVGIDLLPVEPLAGAVFLQADFGSEAGLTALEAALKGHPADLVLCDIAPNLSGIAATDQARTMALAEAALEFARDHLRPGGDMLVKVFQGADFQAFRRAMGELFGQVLTRKPNASRGRSAEIYLLGRGKRTR